MTMPRSVRVPDDLWHAALAQAHKDGRTLTDVVIEALRAYVDGGEARQASGRRCP